ncbi:heat shock protein Hsp70 family protein [Tieghemostelium lacteum]|uniref:Heat shock protein Hsp70 family protein n=1 Tax=Tieghemostelium lacteum TaxID=361077 RepID=A0A151ZIP2_TIELA|nr:heat shock protein Hsp70 family protein [Tieghemostelium lacteum]|eukprot:KYQ93775.1 heat shock protein Hsp70 family protein [Tieghemostelium lacteum]
MFVVGFDFGTKNCTIAVAQKGGVDVIANEVSNRLTPSMVGFGEKERYLGEPALTNQMRQIRNTITNIKRYIGREYKTALEELKKEMFSTFENEGNGYIGCQVQYLNESTEFSCEQILGMLFGKLKKTTEVFVNTKLRDVVISVPVFWNDYQRRAMIDAATIAGLHVLRLMNETTATALSFGIYKAFSETEPTNVLFVDVGDSGTSTAAVQYKKGQLKVLATTFNPNVGSRNFDETLVRYFAKEFQTKYKINVFENKKALLRLGVACEKVKKMLSSNSEVPISIDSLMDDIDVKGTINRDTFEGLIEKDIQDMIEPVRRVIEDSGISVDKFEQIAVTGGGTRSTSLQKKLVEFLGRELNKTINSEESVCRGCAIQCAMLSPLFRVLPFAVNDVATYPITVHYRSQSGVEQKLDLFNTKTPIPSPKPLRISFPVSTSEPFQITARSTYGDIETLQVDKVPTFTNKSSIKAKVWFDIHGIFHIEEVKLVEQILEAEQTEQKEEEQKPQEGTTPEQPKEGSTTSPKPEEAKKVKVQETTLEFVSKKIGLTKQEVQKYFEAECQMQAADLLAQETFDKKNALESYIYDMRTKLTASLKEYATTQEADQFMNKLNLAMDWLETEGDDQTKSVYQNKLDDLTSLGNPITKRSKDREDYPEKVQQLVELASFYKNEALTPSDKYEHIPKEDKEKIIAECDAATEWVNQLVQKDKSTPKTSPCPINASEVQTRKQSLESMSKVILNKPKPAPPKVETPPPQQSTEQKDDPMNNGDGSTNEDVKMDDSNVQPPKDSSNDVEMD